ncbi:MAG: pyridoxamine 5'-phosphate oxidase [Bacteroidota bacterium]|nr:pyridoxamine 5'-phosphate oxidase [Bacteroidota bacterium]
MDLSDFRKQYTKGRLIASEVPPNPFILFKNWFEEVQSKGKEQETNAMTLSTQQPDGGVASRVVLLKEVSDEGFVFYTNYNSSKGQSIEHNNQVCISFFWQSMERQVIIQGTATKLPPEESDQYFQSRPRGSQMGAHVSNQSEVIENRFTLERRLKFLEEQYKNKPIPRPTHWGGYVVSPHSIEFWQGRTNRLHDRLVYIQKSSTWVIKRLSP